MEVEESSQSTEPASTVDVANDAKEAESSKSSSKTENNDTKESTSKEAGDEPSRMEVDSDPNKEAETADRQREKSKSPEPSCSICLGKLENKSFTDSCFHMFCFVCLMEWSKVKPVCPLCKQPFKSIIHNVRSNEDYDQYHIEMRNQSTEGGQGGNPTQHRFRYRTTMTHQNWIERQFELQRRQLELTTTRSMWRRHRQASTSAFRKRIYNTGMRVSEVRTACGRPLRQREVSPAFFSRNPACTHRLVPWLNRELNALLHNHEDNVQFVLELILDLLKRFEIRSPEFAEHLRSFLSQRTEHFIHEFYTFARSPYDMVAYDGYAVYGIENNSQEPHEISSSSDSEDSVISIDIIASPTNNAARNPINDGGVIVLNSDDEDVIAGPSEPGPSTSRSGRNLLNSVRNFLSAAATEQSVWGWDSPPLSLDWRAPSTSHTVLPVTVDTVLDLSVASSSQEPTVRAEPTVVVAANNVENRDRRIVIEHEDEITEVAAVDGNSSPLSVRSVKVERESFSSYGSEVEIVGYEKPWDDRSAVDVSSPDEEELKVIEELKKKRKVTEKKVVVARSSSSSSDESRVSRRRRKRRRRTRSRSRSRHRSRSESTSYFREYDRKRRERHKKSRRSRSRSRARRSRSRARHSRSRDRRSRSRERHSRLRDRHSRSRDRHSRSRDRHSRSRDRRSKGRERRTRSRDRNSRSSRRRERSYSRVSDSSRRSRRRRHSRSTSRRKDRHRSRSRSYSRSRRVSRSRSRTRKSKNRSRSRTRRDRRRSKSPSVEFCSLGKYDMPSKRRDRDNEKRRKQDSSYTSEWVYGKKSSDSTSRKKRDSSSSDDSSVVCISRNSERKRRKTTDSIEVVYESEKKSKKKQKSDKKDSKRRSSRSVSVESRSRRVKELRSRRSRSKESRRSRSRDRDHRSQDRVSYKKNPTGHKSSSKTSKNRERSRHSP